MRLPARRSSPDGLPVTARIAEHAEHVVHAVGRPPQGRCPPGGRSLARRAGLRRRPPELQRADDRVGRGLVGVDGHRRRHRSAHRWIRRRCRGTARREPRCGCRPRPAGRVVARPRAGRPWRRCRRPTPERDPRAGSPPIAPNWSGRSVPAAVAMGLGEQPVHCGQATAGRRVVDHVVVHQRARMEQLKSREQPQYGRIGVAVGDRRANPSRRTQAAAACPRVARTSSSAGRQVGVSRCRCRRESLRRSSEIVPPVDPSRRWPSSMADWCRCVHAQRGAPFSRRFSPVSAFQSRACHRLCSKPGWLPVTQSVTSPATAAQGRQTRGVSRLTQATAATIPATRNDAKPSQIAAPVNERALPDRCKRACAHHRCSPRPACSFHSTTSGATWSPLVDVTSPGKDTESDDRRPDRSTTSGRHGRQDHQIACAAQRTSTPAASRFMFASWGARRTVRSENTACEPT